MIYIIYDIATGTVLTTSQTQPAPPTNDKAIAQVNFNFIDGVRPCMYKYDGSGIVANSEANIQLFAPFIMSEIVAMKNMNFTQYIQNPELNQTVYVKDLDITMEFNGVDWVQCGSTTILRKAFISGVLYANNVQIG